MWKLTDTLLCTNKRTILNANNLIHYTTIGTSLEYNVYYMYVCMYVKVYVCIHVCTCMHVYVHVCTYIVCTYVCMYICMYVYMYVCMYVCVYMYMYACTCMYVCMYIQTCMLASNIISYAVCSLLKHSLTIDIICYNTNHNHPTNYHTHNWILLAVN